MSKDAAMIRKKRIDFLKNQGSTIALVLLVVIISVMQPQFRSMDNIMVVLRQASINGLIAFGMTAIILTGGIDLSVGSTLGLTAMITAGMMVGGMSEVIAIPLGLLLGVVLGLVNGLFITKFRLQPFIATLVTMTIYRGFVLIYSEGRPVSGLGHQPILNEIGRGSILGVPTPIWIFILMFVLFSFILNKTTLGRRIYAVGSNPVAAELAGVNIHKTKMIVYMASGLMAAIAGMILLSRLGSAQPTLGSGFELDAIAATALGGTSMSGGRGRIYGTIIGVLIIAILSSGLNIMNVPSFYQEVVKGFVILLAVLADPAR